MKHRIGLLYSITMDELSILCLELACTMACCIPHENTKPTVIEPTKIQNPVLSIAKKQTTVVPTTKKDVYTERLCNIAIHKLNTSSF
jgi:hypothetical protein